MTTYIKSIKAIGLYGRFDIDQEFHEGINIIFGKNGAGKTTLLHILANALSGDFDRFDFLKFRTIVINLSNGSKLSIISKVKKGKNSIEVKLDNKVIFPIAQHNEQASLFMNEEEDNKYYKLVIDDLKHLSEREKLDLLAEINFRRKRIKEIEPVANIAYFPAFRTMIEAWVAAATNSEPKRRYGIDTRWKDLATERARDWFGGFTPMVNFPSLVEIEHQLAIETEEARSNVWRSDQKLLSDAFLKIFASISKSDDVGEDVENIFKTMQGLSRKLEQSPLRSESRIDIYQLRQSIDQLLIGTNLELTAFRVLRIYRDILQNMVDVQAESFVGIDRYLSSVNEFLDGKSLIYKPDVSQYRGESVQIQYEDNSSSKGLRSLSSGERQIMTLVYAATHMSQQEIVLIDEPEISLHVDWQRKLISRMAEQLGDRQIIACTHSPIIGANHLDKMSELALAPTKIKIEDNSDNIDD